MNDTPYRYTAELAERIELAWQDRWESEGTFHAPNPAGPWADPEGVAGPARSCSSWTCSPTPPAPGLHVGHPLGYIATDVYARFQRMTGKNVLHCLGYDAFGLPAEQYAVQTGQHPRKTTEDNIVTMKRPAAPAGPGPRRPPHDRDDRRGVLPLDAVDLPADLQQLVRRVGRGRPRPGPADRRAGGRCWSRASARRRTAGAWSELAPPSGARSSTVSGWPTCPRRRSTGARAWAPCWPTRRSPPTAAVRARQLPGVQAQPAPVDDADHRVRRPAGRRPGPAGLARAGQADAAQLDRPLARGAGVLPAPLADGTVAPIEVFTTRPDTLFGATFMVLAPEHPLVDSLVPQGGWPDGTRDAWTGGSATPGGSRRGIPAVGRRARATSSGRPRARTRPVCSPARSPPTRSTARRSRSSSPTTC